MWFTGAFVYISKQTWSQGVGWLPKGRHKSRLAATGYVAGEQSTEWTPVATKLLRGTFRNQHRSAGKDFQLPSDIHIVRDPALQNRTGIGPTHLLNYRGPPVFT